MSIASIIVSYALIENKKRDNKHPCLILRAISPGSESPLSVLLQSKLDKINYSV